MAHTARIRLITPIAQATIGPVASPMDNRAAAEPSKPRQPLMNKIHTVIEAKALKIGGISLLLSAFIVNY
jgi:hypothetical protein